MASNLISSWLIEGEKVKAVTDFIFLGRKITVDGDSSHRIKRHFLRWKVSYDKHSARLLNCFSPVQLFVPLWIVAHQDPLSMGFSRQEYWTRLPCLPPGGIPDPGIKPTSPVAPALQTDFYCWATGKPMINLGSIWNLKSRDITLLTNVWIVKAMVFPVVMYRCESWIVKKAQSQRIDAFKLWCWRRLLRVPWTERRSNHSILKEINPECSLEELILKLLQYFGHLI